MTAPHVCVLDRLTFIIDRRLRYGTMSVRKNLPISPSPKLHAVAERMVGSRRCSCRGDFVLAGLRPPDEREQGFHDLRVTISKPAIETVFRVSLPV